jgi:Zn-dependent protease
MESGYFKIGRLGGAPIRVHWTAPLGAFMFCGFRLAPVAWAAFVVLILIHEIGHALWVRSARLHLESIDVHGLGGVCRYYGTTTPVRRALIAWGGVLAQAVLLAIAFVLSRVLPHPASPDVQAIMNDQVWDTFIRVNLMLIAFNLLPIPGFDGVEAWKLFGKNGLRAWWRERALRKRPPIAVVRPMQPRRRFISNNIADDILENTPTDQKRPPPHMLN